MTRTLTFKETAEYLGFTVEAFTILVNRGYGPLESEDRPNRYELQSITFWEENFPESPNELLNCVSNPLLIRHEDGRWWKRVSYERALSSQLSRFFDGRHCSNGHCCEWYTQTQECVHCVAQKRSETLRLKAASNNFSDSPGCN